MKKIIDGKTYNTETAEFLGVYQHLWKGDFHYYREELYRTKKGTFFIYGEGNGASPYAEHFIDGYGPGDDMRILSESEAKEWAECELSADEYVEIFGEPEEG